MSNGENRQIIKDVAESVSLPACMELQVNGNWTGFIVKEKSVIVPFLVYGWLYQVEIMVWGSFAELNKKALPAELVAVCLQIQKIIKAEQAMKKFNYNQERKTAQEIVNNIPSDDEIDQAFYEFTSLIAA
jgi:hypothetical protein